MVQAGTYAFSVSAVREPVVPARLGASAGLTLTVTAGSVVPVLLRLSGSDAAASFLASNPLSFTCDASGRPADLRLPMSRDWTPGLWLHDWRMPCKQDICLTWALAQTQSLCTLVYQRPLVSDLEP